MSQIRIEKIKVIKDPEEKENLWLFYERAFQQMSEKTPIAQIWPKEFFITWLENVRVIKFIVREKDKVVGLGIATSEVKLDWLLSPAYFNKHFPGRPIIHFPVLAISDHLRRTKKVVVQLVKMMINEVPENGLGVFFYSKMFSSQVPKLTELVGSRHIKGTEYDAEVCCIYEWSGGKIDLLTL